MKKWGKYLIAAVVVIFVGSNLFLLLKEDSKAARTINISDWTTINKGNVKKILHTNGVTQPETETHMYFDSQKGSLGEILVKEGDVVTSGTPLFSYDSQKLEERKADLEDEAKRLQGEMDSIDQEISQLQQIDTNATSDTTSTSSNSKKVKLDVNVNVSSIVEGNVQEKVAEAEAEKGKLEAALTENEAKKSRVEKELDDLNVVSTVDGQIVKINPDLKDPMMTIASTNSVVKAIVPAKQIQEVITGQQVELYSKLTDQTYKGTVAKVITYPNKDKKKNKEPMYSFLVKLNSEAINEANADKNEKTDNTKKDGQATDGQISNATTGQSQSEQTTDTVNQENQMAVKEDKPLLVGTDMKMQVTVDEATGVPTIYSKSMWKSGNKHYVYQLTTNGVVQKQPITLGVAYKGKNQVVKGLQANDVIISDQDAISLASTSNFITPIKTYVIQKKELKSMTKKQLAQYILTGLFE
ncbi:efflux RND transporter periplasmic adaptor subunit [Rummeliibacillus sp. NPDC094406]|uniref:efflux RND transporter periplasmic adaptor subunit n=1 Tax=Rummeliibacillus sp. NPDC094406 TaxID=3364511 RepID=UPI0037FB0863